MKLPSGVTGCHLNKGWRIQYRKFSFLVEVSNQPDNFFNKCGQIWQVRHVAKVGKSPTNNTVELRLCFHLDFREAHHSKEEGMDCRSSRVCPSYVALMLLSNMLESIKRYTYEYHACDILYYFSLMISITILVNISQSH